MVLDSKGLASGPLKTIDIKKLTGLPQGTVNPALRDLEKKSILRNEKGRYSVPNYSITKISEMFSKND